MELVDWPHAQDEGDRQVLRERILRSDKGSILLLDENRRPVKWLTVRDLDRPGSLAEVGLPARDAVVETNATLHEALDLMITSYTGAVVVVDGQGAYRGVVELDAIRKRVDEIRTAARQHMRKEPGAVLPEELVG